MEKKKPRMHTPAFKTQVVLSLLKGDKTRNEISSEFGIHPTQADLWKQKVLAGMPSLFGLGNQDALKERDKLIEELYKQVGKLQTQLDWLKKKMGYTDF
jgi:transposase-like protein